MVLPARSRGEVARFYTVEKATSIADNLCDYMDQLDDLEFKISDELRREQYRPGPIKAVREISRELGMPHPYQEKAILTLQYIDTEIGKLQKLLIYPNGGDMDVEKHRRKTKSLLDDQVVDLLELIGEYPRFFDYIYDNRMQNLLESIESFVEVPR